MRSFHPPRSVVLAVCLLGLLALTLLSCGDSSDGATTSTAASTDTSAGPSTEVTFDTSGPMVAMPSIMGLTEAEADDALTAVGLELDPSPYWTISPGEWGRLIDQGPYAEGLLVPVGTVVPVHVGAEGIVVPDVVDLLEDDGEDALEACGLEPEVSLVPDFEYSGSIVEQDPLAGVVVEPGSTVQIGVQALAVELDDLLGWTQADVEQYCAACNIRLHIRYVYATSPDQVVRVQEQDPAPGTVLLEHEDEITVTIAVTAALKP